MEQNEIKEEKKEIILKLLMPKKAFLKLEDCSGQPEENKLDEILDNINKINVFSVFFSFLSCLFSSSFNSLLSLLL